MPRFAAAVALCSLLFACGRGDNTRPPETSTAADPTATPTARPTTAFAADDPTDDCLSNQNAPLACEPAALDMRRFTVDRDAAGSFVFTIEVGGGGFPALGPYTLLVGIDTDRNAATGHTGCASFHGLAPDVELRYVLMPGQPAQASVRTYMAGAPAGQGDASLVEWGQLEPNRLQALVKPALIGNATSFWVVTDLNIADRYDHIPDNGRVAYPESRILPR